MPTIRLYHGTAHDFAGFDDGFRRRGTEPNSCLGIHLTDDPAVAAHYAETAAHDRNAGDPQVLVVEVSVDKAAVVSSYADFMGRRPEDEFTDSRSAVDFVDARADLMTQGFEALCVDADAEDLKGAWVVFDPASISIIERMTPAAARQIEADPWYPEVAFEEVILFPEDHIPELTK